MTILLTGATGYLGSRVARRLLDGGHGVVVVVRSAARLPQGLRSRVRPVVHDLTAPVPPSLLGDLSIDVLVHAAAEIRGTETPERLFAVNASGTRHAVEAALSRGARRLVIISSLEAAGPHGLADGETFENLDPRPVTAYGQSKLAGEQEAGALAAAAGVPVVILRMGNLYGDGEAGLVATLVTALSAPGAAPAKAEWWNHRFQPVHVEDAVAAVVLAVHRGESIYNITDGQRPTVGDLVRDLSFVAGWRGLPVPDATPPPEAAPSPGRVHYRHRIDRAQRELGYEPAFSFRRGVMDMVDQLGFGLPRVDVAEERGVLRTLLLNTPSVGVRLNRDMGGGMGFVHDNADRFPPLDLLWLAATLEKRGWPVSVIDGEAHPATANDLVHHVTTQGIHAIVAEVNLPTFEPDLALLREVKRYTRTIVAAKTVLTEPEFHARLLTEAGVDLVITGECDLTIDNVLLGRDLRGTTRLREGNLVATPEDRLPDLDLLPLPARHLIPHTAYCYHLLPLGFSTVQSSRGCPYSCGYYCPYPLTQGTTWRARSPAHVVAELEACQRLGLRSILFRDATFTLSRSRTLEICRLIQERDLDLAWWCETRINCLDRELLEQMARAGCRGINFGIESGDDAVLAREAKHGVNVQRIRQVLAEAHRAGIHAHLLVVVGLPAETRETIASTWRLLGELPARSLGVTGVTPFPGTALWTDARRAEWILSTDWDRYGGNDTVMATDHLSAADIRFAGRMLYEHFAMTREGRGTPREVLEAHRRQMEQWVASGLPDA